VRAHELSSDVRRRGEMSLSLLSSGAGDFYGRKVRQKGRSRKNKPW